MLTATLKRLTLHKTVPTTLKDLPVLCHENNIIFKSKQ